MEKQCIKSDAKSFRRLLTAFIISVLLTNTLFAQVVSLSEINNLRISPSEGQKLYTKTEIKFEVKIPKAKAAQIQLISGNQSQDISFKTMRKSEDFENGGTLIEIWYSFDKKGSYTLDPLQVSIQGRKRAIKFSPVTITDDPASQMPRIIIKFNNGTTVYSDNGLYTNSIFTNPVGKKISFVLYLQYASQLMNFTWDIPKDAIFSQTRTYEIMEVKYREKNVSHDLIPVASFEWTSLAKGKQTLPKMKLTATAYNGQRCELIMPELTVNFSDGEISNTTSKDEQIFDEAFIQLYDINSQETGTYLSPENCRILADLYSKERNSVFTHTKAKKIRQKFELENNLPVNYEREYSIHLVIAAILLFLGAIIILFLSVHERKNFRIFISILILCFSIVLGIYGIIKRLEAQGICTGCTIYSIPEENAEAKAEMGSGNKVKITEKTGKWLYIELGETGGWCRAENIIVIK